MAIDINKLFTEAQQAEASDVHLVSGLKPYFRIHGSLISQENWPEMDGSSIAATIRTTMTDEQWEKCQTDLNLDYSYEVAGVSRFRMNAHFEKTNMGLVARLIPTDIPTMENLALPPVMMELTRSINGLVLVTGPTGSGKSTTLAAMINQINAVEDVHIITLEDPIEFVYHSNKSIVRQRQLFTDVHSFDDGLKTVLRQDPDVVLLGEMRDLETIKAALTIAETGHLVFATLHTNSAPESIDRIVDVFPPHQQSQIRTQLATTLNAVVSQLLIPKVGGGRIATREILVNTPAVANLIRENKIPQLYSVMQTSADIGMITRDKDLEHIMNQGLITQETYDTYASAEIT